MRVSHPLLHIQRTMKEEITNVARIGLLLGGKYSVYVKTDDELQIPHVHIWDNATNGRAFDCSVTLADCQHLPHGCSIDILSTKLLTAFLAFMQQPCRNPHYQSNREYALEMWIDNNG